jgi:hypothetical protein
MRWGLSLEIEMGPPRHFLRIFPAPKQNSSASSTTVHLPNGPISLETADTELRNRLPTKAGFLDAMATLFDATGPPGLCAQRLAWGRPPGVFGGFSGLAVFLQSNHLWREPDALREWVRTLALLFEEPTLAAAVRREAPSLSPAE